MTNTQDARGYTIAPLLRKESSAEGQLQLHVARLNAWRQCSWNPSGAEPAGGDGSAIREHRALAPRRPPVGRGLGDDGTVAAHEHGHGAASRWLPRHDRFGSAFDAERTVVTRCSAQ